MKEGTKIRKMADKEETGTVKTIIRPLFSSIIKRGITMNQKLEEKPETTYPEHKKLSNHRERSQIVGEFLEWLKSEEYQICYLNKKGEKFYHNLWMPIPENTERLLSMFFDIDLDKLEKEKQNMLTKMRKRNK